MDQLNLTLTNVKWGDILVRNRTYSVRIRTYIYSINIGKKN